MRPLDLRWPLIVEAIAGRDFAVSGADGRVTSVVVREAPRIDRVEINIVVRS